MATTHSVRPSAAVKSKSPRQAERERQELLAARHREREELSEFLLAFEFDDAPEPDDARSLIPLFVF